MVLAMLVACCIKDESIVARKKDPDINNCINTSPHSPTREVIYSNSS